MTQHLEYLHNFRWTKGHIETFWTKEDYANLEYVKQDITEEEKKEWTDAGYSPDTSFTGKMYSNKNEPPAFVEKFKDIFTEFTNLTYTFYKMETQDIMPEHSDHFRTYKRIFNVEDDDVVRILVMLEDWKPGHYLEIARTGIVNWVAGDYYIWEHETKHAASNIGKINNPRYTLQITATKKRKLDLDTKLYNFNIHPDIQSTGLPEKYVVDRLRRAIKDNDGKPYQIYTGNNNIKAYENLEFDNDTISKLNEQGFTVYLYEPMCSYDVLRADERFKHTERFYSEFGDIDPENLRSDELDSILAFKKKLGLTNVTVRTCDYDIDKYYPYYKNELNLVTDDIFLKAEHFIPIVDGYYLGWRQFTHKFLCMSYRYTFHRHLLACYAAQTGSSMLGWVFKCDMQNMHKSAWHDMESIKQKNSLAYDKIKNGLIYLNNNVPLNLDFDFPDATVINDIYHKTAFPQNRNIKNPDVFEIEKSYKTSFCELIGETRFAQPTANYSEKVYRPMFYKRPFIIAAPPYTLKYMREQGFKTFSDFWDESYDNITNHEDRLLKIYETIDYINNMDLIQIEMMYNAMMPILEHNLEMVTRVSLPVIPEK